MTTLVPAPADENEVRMQEEALEGNRTQVDLEDAEQELHDISHPIPKASVPQLKPAPWPISKDRL